MLRRIRLWSALVLTTFLIGHLANHALGIVSIEAMNAGLAYTVAPWRTDPGTVLLAGAAIAHVIAAFVPLWRRRALRLARTEWLQLALGALVPLLLATHLAGTRIAFELFATDGRYPVVLIYYWIGAPAQAATQSLLVLVAWTHACIGLRAWLRFKPWYRRWRDIGFSVALLLPALALSGFVSAGREVRALAAEPGWVREILAEAGYRPEVAEKVYGIADGIRIAAVVWLVLFFAVRHARGLLERRRGGVRLEYQGTRELTLEPGATVLDTVQLAGITHTSVCGGRGRCSTCRVRVDEGHEQLPPPSPDERRILDRVTSDPRVRLACQLRPSTPLSVTPLIRAGGYGATMGSGSIHGRGAERTVAVLFVDLRGSTRLAEARLPFDVLYVLNQFFVELSSALEETRGFYAQFNGDGLMALYGLNSDVETGCRDALAGAAAMLDRMDRLNARLKAELNEPLRVGIGVHAGEAIVGSMGPPDRPIVSAIGDSVNIAARLELATKAFEVPLVVSFDVARHSGVDFSGCPSHPIEVRGRATPITVYAVTAQALRAAVRQST